ncbi:MAG: ribonuclease HII [Rikenellaceae bacterium]
MLKNSYQDQLLEAGCDEAGRGCLAGSVFGASVILPPDFYDPKLNDSKQVSAKQRERLRRLIEAEAVAWGVAEVTAEQIDQINILRAAHLSMSNAVRQLKVQPELLLIDGNLFYSDLETPHQCVVGGDALYTSIAAASILAKCHRDEYIIELSQQYPHYDWQSNKGYPTAKHRRAIEEYGLTPHHRLTFGKKR